MPKLDTHDLDAVAGAMYFIVGRGTEGGPASYRLSIAGIGSRTWGEARYVKADSGYSIGAIQVDLGKRGTWPLGATVEAALEPGQRTYVDAIIEESANFAKAHGLNYANDKARLRSQLLTHGNGMSGRSSLEFIDTDTRNSINAWACSEAGRKWIHRNIDYPQIRQATRSAIELVDRYGRNVPDEHRLEVIAILVKTENQIPAKVKAFEEVLKDGGDFAAVVAEAESIASRYSYYAGLKAAKLTAMYEGVYRENAAALERAQAKVSDRGFDPSSAAADPDVQQGLRAIGQAAPHVLRDGSHGREVMSLQNDLAKIGVVDAQGHAIRPDGAFGPSTREALQAFQRAQGLEDDGLAGPKTLQALREAARQQSASLADRGHPGHPLFYQALEQVHRIDARCGRTPDKLSCNLAGALAVAAQAQGLERIDYVVLGQNATRAIAVQGELDSPRRRMVGVDLLQAVATPLEQSSAGLLATPQQREAALPAITHPQALSQPALQEIIR